MALVIHTTMIVMAVLAHVLPLAGGPSVGQRPLVVVIALSMGSTAARPATMDAAMAMTVMVEVAEDVEGITLIDSGVQAQPVMVGVRALRADRTPCRPMPFPPVEVLSGSNMTLPSVLIISKVSEDRKYLALQLGNANRFLVLSRTLFIGGVT
jgi:hypothetical protein